MGAVVTPTDARAGLEAVMRATLADELEFRDWEYEPVRPCGMPTKTRRWTRKTRVRGDCSKGVQFVCWWTPGVPDPMGSDWGEYGNSYTLWLKLQHLVDASDRYDRLLLEVGDIVTFGADGQDHAAMVLEKATKANGWDPLVWSFGHPGAPNTYRLSQDPRPQQYLRNPVPKYVPTPADRLRARTGWFAWMAWYEGEGDWKPYGAKSRSVRPSVPRVIPLGWWRRRARFLLRRKSGTPSTAATPRPAGSASA